MRTLLLVEDDRMLMLSMKTGLQKDGWTVTGVPSAEEAVRELEERAFDLVVTDYMLSTEKDGLFLLAYLKEHAPGLPAILISGSRDHGLDREARDLGAFCFLRKPFDLHVFLGMCRSALARDPCGPGPLPAARYS